MGIDLKLARLPEPASVARRSTIQRCMLVLNDPAQLFSRQVCGHGPHDRPRQLDGLFATHLDRAWIRYLVVDHLYQASNDGPTIALGTCLNSCMAAAPKKNQC